MSPHSHPTAMVADLPGSDSWRAVRPEAAERLTDARLQAHHALQFVSALGISYLTPASDDSHTSLRWDARAGALVSHATDGVALGLRVSDLTLLVLNGARVVHRIATHGHTIDQVYQVLGDVLAAHGLDAARYTLRRHFEIPSHPVHVGAAFDTSDQLALQELSTWFHDAALLLDGIRRQHRGSEVACWPHHFDIATLITIAPGRTSGAGLSAGDHYYEQPYFYVNAYPAPSDASALPVLDGDGHWHTHEWTGAVLPGSLLAASDENDAQVNQARQFLDSALQFTLNR